MLGDSLGVLFVAKSNNVKVENKRQNLKFYGGFKGAISTTMTREKIISDLGCVGKFLQQIS
jgi:hypothetical protein